MNYWYETEHEFVTIEYGRYEAVHDINKPGQYGQFTWEPVLAGPAPADD